MARTKYSRAARRFLSEEISHLIRKGYPRERAVAAAMAMARRKGLKVPSPRRNPELVLANPTGHRRMASAVYEIAYKHVADGLDYKHQFEDPDNVELYILSPYKVLIFGRHKPIIGLFERE